MKARTLRKKHNTRNTRGRSAVNRIHRRRQVGEGKWWFKSRNKELTLPQLGSPPVSIAQVGPSSYTDYDIDEERRLLHMFEQEKHIRQMYNIDLEAQEREFEIYARQRREKQSYEDMIKLQEERHAKANSRGRHTGYRHMGNLGDDGYNDK